MPQAAVGGVAAYASVERSEAGYNALIIAGVQRRTEVLLLPLKQAEDGWRLGLGRCAHVQHVCTNSAVPPRMNRTKCKHDAVGLV